MAKLVIIDWQRDSLLIGTGVRRGAAIAFEHIHLAPIGESETGHVTAAQALRKAVQELGLAKSDAVVIAAREVVEIRNLSIPSVDADELPDIIRFQAQRQMANVGDTWPLDYILLPDESNAENKNALAAAISPAHLAEIETAINGAGLQLAQVVLRPIEIARFALQTDTNRTMADGVALIVCITDQQADLMLLKSGAVAQLRSTRLPSDSNLIANALVGEVKRSLVAAASQMEGLTLGSALLIAPAELASKVENAISEAAGCSIAVVDPVIMLPANCADSDALTHSSANRLAAIAGVIGAPNPDKRTSIDFKNPKKRPPREKNVRAYAIAGSVAGLIVLFAGWWWFSTTGSLDQELAEIRKEIADNKGMAELAKKQVAEFNEVKLMLDGSPNWLDELENIAVRMPPADKVIMHNTSFTVSATGEGVIKSAVFGNSAGSISDFESGLRKDDAFRVNGSGLQETGAWVQYPWQATETITATGRGWKLLDDRKPSVSTPQSPSSQSKPESTKPMDSAVTDTKPLDNLDAASPENAALTVDPKTIASPTSESTAAATSAADQSPKTTSADEITEGSGADAVPKTFPTEAEPIATQSNPTSPTKEEPPAPKVEVPIADAKPTSTEPTPVPTAANPSALEVTDEAPPKP